MGRFRGSGFREFQAQVLSGFRASGFETLLVTFCWSRISGLGSATTWISENSSVSLPASLASEIESGDSAASNNPLSTSIAQQLLGFVICRKLINGSCRGCVQSFAETSSKP